MANFNLSSFFEAFNSLRARGTATVKSALKSLRTCNNQSQGCSQTQYDSPDESPTLDCGCGSSQRTSRSGWTCRHTPVQQEEPTCAPQPTCSCEPKPTPQPTCSCEPKPTPQPTCSCEPKPTPQPVCTCEPARPPRPQPHHPPVHEEPVGTQIANFGISGGPGNDIIDTEGDDVNVLGNSGIVNVGDNNIYAQNYNVNTFNTVNNFSTTINNPQEPTAAPTVAPTDAPTVAPTIAPTDAPTVAPTDDPGPGPGGDPEYNLMPLMSVLKNIESFDPDGVLSDLELDIAMKNPGNADMDGNNDEISAKEMAIFNKIQQFNQDKNLIANVMKGDISNIDAATLQELQELSDAIKALRDS